MEDEVFSSVVYLLVPLWLSWHYAEIRSYLVQLCYPAVEGASFELKPPSKLLDGHFLIKVELEDLLLLGSQSVSICFLFEFTLKMTPGAHNSILTFLVAGVNLKVPAMVMIDLIPQQLQVNEITCRDVGSR